MTVRGQKPSMKDVAYWPREAYQWRRCPNGHGDWLAEGEEDADGKWTAVMAGELICSECRALGKRVPDVRGPNRV